MRISVLTPSKMARHSALPIYDARRHHPAPFALGSSVGTQAAFAVGFNVSAELEADSARNSNND